MHIPQRTTRGLDGPTRPNSSPVRILSLSHEVVPDYQPFLSKKLSSSMSSKIVLPAVIPETERPYQPLSVRHETALAMDFPHNMFDPRLVRHRERMRQTHPSATQMHRLPLILTLYSRRYPYMVHQIQLVPSTASSTKPLLLSSPSASSLSSCLAQHLRVFHC